MKQYLTLKNGVGAVLILWIMFSIGYIVRDQFFKFKGSLYNDAYQAGVIQSVEQLITQAKSCEPVKVYKDDEEVNLIAIECLQLPNEDTNQNEGE